MRCKRTGEHVERGGEVRSGTVYTGFETVWHTSIAINIYKTKLHTWVAQCSVDVPSTSSLPSDIATARVDLTHLFALH